MIGLIRFITLPYAGALIHICSLPSCDAQVMNKGASLLRNCGAGLGERNVKNLVLSTEMIW